MENIFNFQKFIKEYIPEGISYPSESDYTMVYAYKAGKVVYQDTYSKWFDDKKKIDYTTFEKVKNKEAYHNAVSEYNNYHNIGFSEWKKAVFEYAGADEKNEFHKEVWSFSYEVTDSYSCDFIYFFENTIKRFEKFIK